MSPRRRVNVRVDARGVPDGLLAMRQEYVVQDADGTRRVASRRGATQRLVLVAEDATGELPGTVTHADVQRVLSDETGHRSTRARDRSDELLLPLARAGLVRLHATATDEAGEMTVGPWSRWERTAAGEEWAAAYASLDDDDPAVALALSTVRGRADAHGDAQGFVDAVTAEATALLDICDRASTLVDDGSAEGWSIARLAETLTGDPDGLTGDDRLAVLVWQHLARQLGLGVDASTREGRRRVVVAAGLGPPSLASWVASARIPGGGGAAGALLTAGAAHDVPVLLPRELVADRSQRPVAPPRSASWLFAVQHEQTFAAALEHPVRTPIVWHGGSSAALALLQHVVAAGWQVAVCGDGDEPGRARAAWLLQRLGGHGVHWRPDAVDGERDRIPDLLSDLTRGAPSSSDKPRNSDN